MGSGGGGERIFTVSDGQNDCTWNVTIDNGWFTNHSGEAIRRGAEFWLRKNFCLAKWITPQPPSQKRSRRKTKKKDVHTQYESEGWSEKISQKFYAWRLHHLILINFAASDSKKQRTFSFACSHNNDEAAYPTSLFSLPQSQAQPTPDSTHHQGCRCPRLWSLVKGYTRDGDRCWEGGGVGKPSIFPSSLTFSTWSGRGNPSGAVLQIMTLRQTACNDPIFSWE